MFGMRRLSNDMDAALDKTKGLSDKESAAKLYKAFDRFADTNFIAGVLTHVAAALGLYYGLTYIEKHKERKNHKELKDTDK